MPWPTVYSVVPSFPIGTVTIVDTGGLDNDGMVIAGKSLRFGLALLATVIVAGGCAGAGTRKLLDKADAEQPKDGQDAGAGGTAAASGAAPQESPWILLPLFSSNPKLGTVVGLGGGLIYHFDETSRASKFTVSAQHSTTDSTMAALSAKTSFGEDRHRLNLIAKGGRIMNDYDDYLGTGLALKSVDEAYSLNGSYIYRVSGNWLVGPQVVFSNYRVVGQTASDDEILEGLGVTGVKSGGVGVSVQNDTRDNDNSPTRGWLANLSNSPTANRWAATRTTTCTGWTCGASGGTAAATCWGSARTTI